MIGRINELSSTASELAAAINKNKTLIFGLALTLGASGINLASTALKSFGIKSECNEALASLKDINNETEIVRNITIGNMVLPVHLQPSEKFLESINEIPDLLGELLSNYVFHDGLQYALLITGLGLSFTTIYQIVQYIKKLNSQSCHIDNQVKELSKQTTNQDSRISALEELTQKQQNIITELQSAINKLNEALGAKDNEIKQVKAVKN